MADYESQNHQLAPSLHGAGARGEPGCPAPARVLVLDDEPFIVEVLSEMLQLLGHETVVCLDAAAALDQLNAGEFDAIISDFHMPGMNGDQFYQVLAARKPGLARRVIFLTGDLVNEETQQFLASTGNPHLEKPFQLSRLEAVVAGLLSAKNQLAKSAA